MENTVYFTSKALFVLKMFKFLSWLFGQAAKRLDKKDKINFKFCDVTVWLTNNCNTLIAQYWRSKGNQTMKFGQLIECNLRNIFLEKSYTKCGRETSPRSFSEELKLSMSLRLWRHDFWSLNLKSWNLNHESYLSNQAVFPTWPKSHDKNLNLLRMKGAFEMN